jgi:hypothetical protein
MAQEPDLRWCRSHSVSARSLRNLEGAGPQLGPRPQHQDADNESVERPSRARGGVREVLSVVPGSWNPAILAPS